jgi:hypothetical protein
LFPEKAMPVLRTALRLSIRIDSDSSCPQHLSNLLVSRVVRGAQEWRKVSRRGRLGINQDVNPQVWYGKQRAFFIPSHGRFKVRFPALYPFSVYGQHHRHHSLPVYKSSAIPEPLISRLSPTCRAHRSSHRKTVLGLVEDC